MVVAIVPERQFRTAGCTDACEVVRAIVPGRFGRTELLLHDPESHERYALATAGIDGGATVAWTGPLVVDRWARMATLGGVRLGLTGREWEVLDFLAVRLGRVCDTRELAHSIWGDDSPTSLHTVRIVIQRLRLKLEPAPGLIETAYGRGYRLLQIPPSEDVTPLPVPVSKSGRRLPPGRWARAWECCRACGTTSRPHQGYGLCMPCRDADRKERKA